MPKSIIWRSVVGQDHVFGLEVAVQHAVLVHLATAPAIWIAKSSARLSGKAPRPSRARSASPRTTHRDERLSIDLIDAIDGGDVRVIDRRGKPCFLREPLPAFRIARERHRDDFDCGFAPEL
jgi:hypothetical protein